MKYLFDPSAIFNAIKENKIGLLARNYTLELAGYELGNILWKECVLQAKTSKEEAKILMRIAKQALSVMEVLQITSCEEEVLESSAQFKITFYDASYVYFARVKELQLITEDLRLIKKITPTIKASRLNEIE